MTVSFKAKTYANLLAVYFVWGSTFLGVRYAIDVLPPLMVSTLRFLVGGIILFVFTLIKGEGLPTAKQFWSAAWIGMLLSGIGNGIVAYCIKFMPTGLVALMVATLPAWVVGLDYFFFAKKRPSNLTIIGILIGLVGMYVLLDPLGSTQASQVPLGMAVLIVIASVSWAWGSLQSPYLATPPSTFQTTAVQMLAGGVFALLMSLIFEPNGISALDNMTTQTYLALGYLIFCGSFVGYSAYVWLIQNAPPSLTATYAYVNPVVAMVLGAVFLGEMLSQRTIIASAIILGGVVLITLGRRIIK